MKDKGQICGEIPGVTLLAGSWELSGTPRKPFSDDAVDFLAALSDKIRGLSRREAGEELRTLGFWLRRAHLLGYAAEYQKRHENPRLGMGISFHIAPSNVPLLFAYTCAIGLLAGNSCRVRISGREAENSGAGTFLRLVEELLAGEFAAMRQRISFVTYDSARSDLTELFSAECGARVIWGGDETVRRVRAIPMKAQAVELAFPDRTSMAVFGAEEVLSLTEEALLELANRFYNDTYAMDQNACSCPKIVFWQEKDAASGREASERFWNALASVSEKYPLSEIKVSEKYGTLWEFCGFSGDVTAIRRFGNRLYVLETKEAGALAEETDDGLRFGTFLECHMKEDGEWAQAVTEKTQTLAFFGVSKADLQCVVAERGLPGVTRIVPVGQALWMEPVWDGRDMIESLSREIW